MLMSAIERTIREKVHALSDDQQRTVLALVERLAADAAPTAKQLLLLPFEERSRLLGAQIALAANDDFEIFTADDLPDHDTPLSFSDGRKHVFS